MIKTLTTHGDNAALVIDKATLELLNIDMDTPLEVVIDGETLIISPVRDKIRRQRVAEALERVNERHRETLKKLAE
jgi:antitoxin component of MazEF toxin-antitoxin module